ncbi:hypothetical protein PEC301937_02100 [Pectobacterium carotovorum subsp. carotovorum]|nr:hypothetical protein PEC301937_02100 [Pectobacterium carotovorum subsp. carotovorum]
MAQAIKKRFLNKNRCQDNYIHCPGIKEKYNVILIM